MLSRQLDDFGVGLRRGAAEVSQDHLAIAVRDLFPGALGDIGEGLLEIELGDGRDRGAETAAFDDFAHGGDDLREEMQAVVVAHHLGVGREGAARHRRQGDAGVGLLGFRRQHVSAH